MIDQIVACMVAGDRYGSEMLFNSLEFLFFAAFVYLSLLLAIPRGANRSWKIFLVFCSYAFYMSWVPAFGLLLFGSTFVDYAVSRALAKRDDPGVRRLLVSISLVFNLGLLATFKYGDFLFESVAFLDPRVGATPGWLEHLVLPVGISFYTFQTLSYTLDVYRGELRPARSFLDFALYVSFFPQLVAGPIVRGAVLLPQLEERPAVSPSQVEEGLLRILTGLVKKVVLADVLAEFVDAVYAQPAAMQGWEVLLGVYAYAYQIYFDFSGYTDIAIGLALLMGIRLPENFRRPYAASSPQEFWRRWHITLSTWLRDYVYVSLGGNRRGLSRTNWNLLFTMLLGGLWHGAAWHFVVWGGYHGALLVLQRALLGRNWEPRSPLSRIAAQVVTFHLVAFGWMLFRIPELGQLPQFLRALARPGFESWGVAVGAALALALGFLLHLVVPAERFRAAFTRMPVWLQGTAVAGAAFLIFVFSSGTGRFIYFQF